MLRAYAVLCLGCKGPNARFVEGSGAQAEKQEQAYSGLSEPGPQVPRTHIPRREVLGRRILSFLAHLQHLEQGGSRGACAPLSRPAHEPPGCISSSQCAADGLLP